MWCRNCNIETNDEKCPIYDEIIVEDIPVEIYWCVHCKTPIIQNINQADKGICPLCGQITKYLSADLRPVFPEERLLLELLLNNEWMCTCIFRQQEAVASLQVAGGIILCRDSSEFNIGSICKWLVEKNGRMTIQNLTALFNNTFSTKTPVRKIAERMKAYGLWDSLVTDSFDEYIDNLVINIDTEMDEDDLFQEEFF